jgi:hypothetical protein
MQLGPVIHHPLAKEHGLGTSYLERIMDRTIYHKAPMLSGAATRLPPTATLRAMGIGALQALGRQLGLDTSHVLEKSELVDLLEAEGAAAGGAAGAGEDGGGLVRMKYDARVITKLVNNYRFATPAPPGGSRHGWVESGEWRAGASTWQKKGRIRVRKWRA